MSNSATVARVAVLLSSIRQLRLSLQGVKELVKSAQDDHSDVILLTSLNAGQGRKALLTGLLNLLLVRINRIQVSILPYLAQQEFNSSYGPDLAEYLALEKSRVTNLISQTTGTDDLSAVQMQTDITAIVNDSKQILIDSGQYFMQQNLDSFYIQHQLTPLGIFFDRHLAALEAIQNINSVPYDFQQDFGDNLEALKVEIRQIIADSQLQIEGIEVQLKADTDELSQFDPDYTVSVLKDYFPILLLPVRIEAKYMQSQNPGHTVSLHDPFDEIWVRIYPDDLAITYHETRLSENEQQAGINYWINTLRTVQELLVDSFNVQPHIARQVQSDLADPVMPVWRPSVGPWRALVEQYGVERAAWIAKQTKPQNHDNIVLDLKQGITQDQLPAIEFPPLDIKSGAWTEPATSFILPDHFVACVYQIYDEKNPSALYFNGNSIPLDLQIGNDPRDPTANPLDNTPDVGNKMLNVSPKLLWLTDIEEAVRVGMAIKIKTSNIQSGGFNADIGIERLVVLGVKYTANHHDGERLLEKLIEAHHYTDGISLMPIGTPTNNSESGSSGYNSAESLDADNSYPVELGANLFSEQEEGLYKPDGQRLAEALGLDSQGFQHVRFSEREEVDEAIAMNAALWPGTLGYYMEEMLRPVFTLNEIDQTRQFFIRNVQGRGSVPGIRIGKQPYGIMPISHFESWVTDPDSFESGMYTVMMKMEATWQELTEHVAIHYTSDNQNVGGTPQNLMTVLAGEASGLEYLNRYQIGPILSSFLSTNPQLSIAEQYQMGVNRYHHFVSETGIDFNNIIPKIFQHTFHKEVSHLIYTYPDVPVTKTPEEGVLVERLPYSETNKIRPFQSYEYNYLEWIQMANFDQLYRESFGLEDESQENSPDSLLYILMRHSFMLGYWDTAMRLLNQQELVTEADREEQELFGALTSGGNPIPAVERWRRLYDNELMGGNDPYYLQLKSGAFYDYPEQAAQLIDQANGLNRLIAMPTARLERALVEHLDLCSHRLDAWQLGLVNQRLEQKRQQYRKGIYIGSYGWLEKVRFRTRNNLGYIHAPSIDQAKVAAILRHASYSRNQPSVTDNPELFNINLTSSRVRRALVILQGLRDGVGLNEQLGRQFERELHAKVDNLKNLPASSNIVPFPLDPIFKVIRKLFPLVTNTDLAQTGNGMNSIDSLESWNVIDGLALLKKAQEIRPINLTFLYEDENGDDTELESLIKSSLFLTAPSTRYWALKDFIRLGVLELADTIDAVSDLVTAESVFQTTRGNFEAANASLETIASGTFPPQPEVIHTQRNGTSVTHRAIISMQVSPAQLTGAALNTPSLWRTEGLIKTLTPTVTAEPTVNEWLARVLGDPARIQVKYASVINGDGGVGPTELVLLKELDIQPLDLLLLIDNELDNNSQTPFDLHLQDLIRRKEGAHLQDRYKVDYTFQPAGGLLSLSHLLPLISRLQKLLSGRSANATDFSYQTAEASGNPEGFDLQELLQRLQVCKASLMDVFQDIIDVLDAHLAHGYPSLQKIKPNDIPANLAGYLLPLFRRAAAFGIRTAIPKTEFTEKQVAFDTAVALLRQIQAIFSTVTPLIVNSPENPLTIDKLVNALKAMLGDSFPVLPLFLLPQVTQEEFGAALSVSDSLMPPVSQNPLPAQEWLQGVAMVRESMRDYEQAGWVNDVFNIQTDYHQSFEFTLTQLPNQTAGPDHWVGMQYPDSFEPGEDKLCLEVQLPQENLNTAQYLSQLQAGLLVDEWVEVIPRKEQTTGIAFHYDQPNSEAPQTVLLAVSPTTIDNWSWVGLLGCVNEALDMAKRRAVEPEHLLQYSPYATVLPAIVAPVSTTGATIGVDFSETIHQPTFPKPPVEE